MKPQREKVEIGGRERKRKNPNPRVEWNGRGVLEREREKRRREEEEEETEAGKTLRIILFITASRILWQSKINLVEIK